jgi:riboflavin transport system substrate-binding protein
MKHHSRAIVALISAALIAWAFASCAPAKKNKGPSVGVFVPGLVSGNPVYEELVKGASQACADYNAERKLAATDKNAATFRVVEAGTNQADWQQKLTELAVSGGFDYIVSSNPSIPQLCVEALKSAPKQKFIVSDGYLEGNPNIYTAQYNQREQAYLVGYLAGLVTRSSMKGANKKLLVGAVVAQRYDSLDKSIIPGFIEGLAATAPGAEFRLRLVGNWYDSAKGAELAKALMDEGADVILPIAGGANQGVLSAAQERGAYVVWFDSSAYSLAPGTVIGCAVVRQQKLVAEKLGLALRGKLEFGKAEVVNARDGYVDFDDADPLYGQGLPEDIRAKMKSLVSDLRSGKIKLETKTF